MSEIRRRDFLRTAVKTAAAAGAVAYFPGCLDSRKGRVGGIDETDTSQGYDTSGQFDGDDGKDFVLDEGGNSRDPVCSPGVPKDCIYEPADELTDPDLIKVYELASEIINEIEDVLKSTNERQVAQGCGGGGGIFPEKSVQASSGGKTVRGTSNCREFSRGIFQKFDNICLENPRRLGTVSLSKGEYIDGFKQDLAVYVSEIIDSVFVETKYTLQSDCNGPNSPSILTKTVITEDAYDEEVKAVDTKETYKIMIDLRVRVLAIMKKFGFDNPNL